MITIINDEGNSDELPDSKYSSTTLKDLLAKYNITVAKFLHIFNKR